MTRKAKPITVPHMIGELCAAIVRQAYEDSMSPFAADRNDAARFAKSKMLGFWCELAGWEEQEVREMLLSMRGEERCA
jgi:hypothetical protein